ncbi:MAG: aldo/keto reductase [Tildeniella nuda ZEHNDER 1965/U140]|jgi:hypothetical protein|nr:aldo/keto reductase [Tildeniella nuda ZEHNDER 1965/U140]
MNYPKLGFGCAPVLGRVSRQTSLKALSCAYSQGIRHFDVARSYGWGDAENLLGQFLQKFPRCEYTLVSKCGILPSKPSAIKSFTKKTGQIFYHSIPQLRALVRQIGASSFQPSQTYNLSALKFSLDQSLNALKTDYLDVLLLHNYQPEYPGIDDVINWFKETKQSGKIKRYGVCIEGDLLKGLEGLDSSWLISTDFVIQAPLTKEAFLLPSKFRDLIFFYHSPFQFLKSHSFDGRHDASLSFLLAAASKIAHCEAVICSMFNEEHIRQNCSWSKQSTSISPEQIDDFLQPYIINR